MSNYFGNEGPKFSLIKENGDIQRTITLPAGHEIGKNPWQLVQDQRRDVNNNMQTDDLKYKYVNNFTWEPSDESGSTNMQDLLAIINWSDNRRRSIKFTPHSDTPLINFEIIVTKASPYLFTKVPYDAFVLHVESTSLFDNIPDPDGLAAVDMGTEIAVSTVDSAGNLEEDNDLAIIN